MSAADGLPPTVHAACVIVGTRGILLRGKSGTGKSSLCDLLVEAAGTKGHFAAHVADDRTCLRRENGKVVASPAPTIAGKLEVRGLGIVELTNEPEAVLHLVADLVPSGELERYPEDDALSVELEGIDLPFVGLEEGRPMENLRRLRWRMRGLFPKSPDYI